jgi:hypothetical protein
MVLRTSIATWLMLAPLALAAAPDQPAGLTALTHVRVIDGTGGTPLEDATVVIEGNHILAIRPGATAVPAGAKVLDLHGDTVIPGLINAHGHLALIADGQNSATAYTAENVLAELRQYESYGVTSMLSLGLNRDLLYQIREQQRRHGCSGRCSGFAGCPRSALPAGNGAGSPRCRGRNGHAARRYREGLGRQCWRNQTRDVS